MSPLAGFTPAGTSGTIWIGDRFHPVVSCCWRRGFYRPRGGLKMMFDQFGFTGGLERRKGRDGKWMKCLKTKNPAGFAGEQGSRKSMI